MRIELAQKDKIDLKYQTSKKKRDIHKLQSSQQNHESQSNAEAIGKLTEQQPF